MAALKWFLSLMNSGNVPVQISFSRKRRITDITINYVFSSWIDDMCFFKFSLEAKSPLQISQLNDFFSSCNNEICL